jgi:putative Holliday junction resolvase
MGIDIFVFMGKYLAIDFGLKRTGLAITDELKIIASPLETIDSSKLMERLTDLIRSEKVELIVLGDPKRLDGSPTHITQNVQLLREALSKTFPAVQIVLMDERFTSVMAKQVVVSSGKSKQNRADKGLIDQVSAALILQSYLTQQSN